MTLRQFSQTFETIPASTAWYLSELSEMKGRQELFTRQSPQHLIEQSKDRYYETLEQSSLGWHGGSHDPWSYINFPLYILKKAYQEFEERLGDLHIPKGEKTGLIMHAVDRMDGLFTVSGLQTRCPEVGIDMIRWELKDPQAQGIAGCRGRTAGWRKTERWELGITVFS